MPSGTSPPVTVADGCLLGIVSRRDLLKVFVRPDEAVRTDVIRGTPLLAADRSA
ncbi:hypothetical protein OIE66_18125 [Nonomuraea sp. NBC_01738]|uniref:hypothetical protein n=1 Tax=Nonomuraea sp. NBC_01738 TaxID=2976003 RepID=UPI002E128DB9|nr:hypothetical protein OIE66_18125 [Nonomuraea sp. NBC_01738]